MPPTDLSAFGLGRATVLLVEAVDAARRVHQLLLAREERVADRADVHAEVATGREGLVDRPASARDLGRLVVRVSCGFLHGSALGAGLGNTSIDHSQSGTLPPRRLGALSGYKGMISRPILRWWTVGYFIPRSRLR